MCDTIMIPSSLQTPVRSGTAENRPVMMAALTNERFVLRVLTNERRVFRVLTNGLRVLRGLTNPMRWDQSEWVLDQWDESINRVLTNERSGSYLSDGASPGGHHHRRAPRPGRPGRGRPDLGRCVGQIITIWAFQVQENYRNLFFLFRPLISQDRPIVRNKGKIFRNSSYSNILMHND